MSEEEKPIEPGPDQLQIGVSSVPDEIDRTNDPVEEKREDARLAFTVIMLLLFGFEILVGAVAALWSEGAWTRTEEYLRVIVPATLGLLGSAIGFYFGSQR